MWAVKIGLEVLKFPSQLTPSVMSPAGIPIIVFFRYKFVFISRILHVRSGELPSLFEQIFLHFTKTGFKLKLSMTVVYQGRLSTFALGCPIMMGGDRDASSKVD